MKGRRKKSDLKFDNLNQSFMKEKSYKSDNELLQEISEKLSQLIAVIGIAGKERDSQVKYLAEMGFSRSEIARLVGIPVGSVATITFAAKKKSKKSR
jgi:hypothetical protein